MKMPSTLLTPWLVCLILFSVTAATAGAQESGHAKKITPHTKVDSQKKTILAKQLPSYPLDVCAVSGAPLGSMGEPIDEILEGRLVRLCCDGCIKGLKKNPAAAFEAIDKGVIKAQLPTYPLARCVVSKELLQTSPSVIDYVYGTRLVRLTNKTAQMEFVKDPNRYIAQIDARLIESQIKHYPLDVCLVSGDELSEGTHDFLYGIRLVRTCCKRCEKAFQRSPKRFIGRLDAAAQSQPKKDGRAPVGSDSK